MAIAVGKLGMTLDDFYEITPVELKRILDQFNKDRMEFFEYQQIATYMGFGQANSGKRFKSMFRYNNNKKPPRRVSLEQKMKDLEDIQKRIGGGI